MTANVAGVKKIPNFEAAIDHYAPDVVIVTEGKRARRLRDVAGYQLFRWGRRHGREASGINVLVRDGLPVERARLLKMVHSWIGPLQGRRHHGRRYPSLRVTLEGVTWRVLGVHFPTFNNPAAQQESKERVNQWFDLAPTMAAIAAGDFNLLSGQVRDFLEPGVIVVAGTKVDHLACARAAHVDTTRLHQLQPPGMHGWIVYEVAARVPKHRGG